MILGLVGIILLIAGLGFLRQLFNRFFQWLIGVFSGGSEPMPAAPLPSFQPDDLLARDSVSRRLSAGSGAQVENVVVPMLTLRWARRLGLICYKLRSLFRQLKGWIRQKMNHWQMTAGYEQEEESLMSWAQLKKELGERIRRHKPRPRPKLEDQPNDRAKVRWLFCRLREQLRRKKHFDSTQTPLELADARFIQDPRVRRLLEDYNEARYSDHPVAPESVSAGLEALRRMR